jgi:hypothetical protein
MFSSMKYHYIIYLFANVSSPNVPCIDVVCVLLA